MATATQEAPPAADPFAEQKTAPKGEDVEKGKLFDVPKIIIDETQPTALRLAFSGGIPIGFDDATWVTFYNRLRSGKPAELRVSVHVAGTKTSHRRDNDGDVDAVVQTKSIIVTDVHLEDE